jgi:hypothetical protein
MAQETGFANQSNLSQMFRREIGVTPRPLLRCDGVSTCPETRTSTSAVAVEGLGKERKISVDDFLKGGSDDFVPLRTLAECASNGGRSGGSRAQFQMRGPTRSGCHENKLGRTKVTGCLNHSDARVLRRGGARRNKQLSLVETWLASSTQ